MIQSDKFTQILKVLQFDINDINLYYADTLKDPFIEHGMEYHKKYTVTDEFRKLVQECDNIQRTREEKLYCRIFNFTQTYYSIYKYLTGKYTKKIDSQQNKIIEDYFAIDKKAGIVRTEISNALKHNPKKDLIYKTKMVKDEMVSQSGKQIIITNHYKTWFYDGIDTVEHYNALYNELLEFLNKNHFN